MQYITSGESHSEKLVVIVRNVPFGISVCKDDFAQELNRRSSTFGRSSRQRTESNEFNIISGVRNGKTTGGSVCVEIANNVLEIAQDKFIPRPGHADLNGALKLNVDDVTLISEVSSARQTAARVVAGVIAKNFLVNFRCEVYSFVSSIGSIKIDTPKFYNLENLPYVGSIEFNELRCPDEKVSKDMKDLIVKAKSNDDTLGGSFYVVATGVDVGLGGYDSYEKRLDSHLSYYLMSIPSVKGVEIGSIYHQAQNIGSVCIDNIEKSSDGKLKRSTNYNGGIEGGMTTGDVIFIKCFVKPVPTTSKPFKSINLETNEAFNENYSMRHDTCVVPACGVIAESEVAIVLANAYMDKFGHDTMSEIIEACNNYRRKLKMRFS